jgi:hypothetical protein
VGVLVIVACGGERRSGHLQCSDDLTLAIREALPIIDEQMGPAGQQLRALGAHRHKGQEKIPPVEG